MKQNLCGVTDEHSPELKSRHTSHVISSQLNLNP